MSCLQPAKNFLKSLTSVTFSLKKKLIQYADVVEIFNQINILTSQPFLMNTFLSSGSMFGESYARIQNTVSALFIP